MVFSFINPKMPKRHFLFEKNETSSETAEVSRFDAENATNLTADFLKRLGYKGNWLPMKVSLEGERTSCSNVTFKN